MSVERLMVDLETLDNSYPVKKRNEVMPDGSIHEATVWDKARLQSLLESIEPGAWAGKEIVYTGLPPCWAIAAVDHRARPERSYHVTHYLNDSQQEMYALPVGKENPESEISIEMIEEGSKLYLWVGADDPAVGYHYYNPEKLKKAVAPIIPEGKDLYLIADAATFILLCYEKTYAPLCRSVSVSFFHDRVNNNMTGQRLFTCCYTTCDDIQLGDKELVPEQLNKKKPLKEV